MTGNDIPLTTWYRHTDKGITTFKKPKYILQTYEEIKAKQDKLGKNAAWYYGTDCEKCCGVYPAFMTEDSFENKGYYVCLVCGKESVHEPMSWIARDSWNAGRYKWKPSEFYQMSMEEWLKGEKNG